MHAQHCGRALGGGGELPVRPGAHASGDEGRPAALSRRLCAGGLGPLEPVQPGELLGQIKDTSDYC